MRPFIIMLAAITCLCVSRLNAAVPSAISVQSSQGRLIGMIKGADFNSTVDQAINTSFPSFIVRNITVTNASASLTLAAGGFYTGASKTGTVIVPATQPFATLTASSKFLDLTPAAIVNTDTFTSTMTIYFSLTTANGTAATADVYIIGDPLV